MVALLNGRGLTTARGKPFTIASMRSTRQNHHLPAPSTPRENGFGGRVPGDAQASGGGPAGGELTSVVSPQIKPRLSHLTSGEAVCRGTLLLHHLVRKGGGGPARSRARS